MSVGELNSQVYLNPGFWDGFRSKLLHLPRWIPMFVSGYVKTRVYYFKESPKEKTPPWNGLMFLHSDHSHLLFLKHPHSFVSLWVDWKRIVAMDSRYKSKLKEGEMEWSQ